MAEFCHTFIDSRSFNAFSLLRPCPLSSKAFCALPLHSPRSRKRSSRNRLTFSAKSTSPTSSSSALDVVSTSEHSDGSLLFRFGDASELARSAELDSSSSLEKSLTRENSDEKLNSVEVLDVEQGKHVINKEIESQVARDGLNKVAISNIDVAGGEVTSKIHETLPISANNVTKFGESSETPASEVVDTDTNGCSGSKDHQGDSASEVCNSSSTEVVLGLQETEEHSAIVNDLADLTGAHDVPKLDKNGYIEKSGSALLEILQVGGKGESASGSAGVCSGINLNNTTEVHQSEDHVVNASLTFEYEEAIGLSSTFEVAPESKVDGAESVLDQEVRGGMPGELLDTKELLPSQPILAEEVVSHEPDRIEILTESKMVGAEYVLDQEVNGDISAVLLDSKELLLSQPILVEEVVSHEPDKIEILPESKVVGAESVLDQEDSCGMSAELLEPKELLLSQSIIVERVVSHESDKIEILTESKVVGAESVLDQEVSGDIPAELLDPKELLISQSLFVEEVSHEPEGIELHPDIKMVGTESVLDQEVRDDMPTESLDTNEFSPSQPILVEEVSHEPEGIDSAPESKVVAAESVLDQEDNGDMPTEFLDPKELSLSQPILVEEVNHEPEGIEIAPESKVVGVEPVLNQEIISDMPGELLVTMEPLSQHILLDEVIHEPEGIEVAPEFKVVGVESAFDQEVSRDLPAELLDTNELLSVEGLTHESQWSLERKPYDQSQIYVTAANETVDVQKNGSIRPMNPAEFVKTEETDLVESLGHGLFKRETVDTHCSEQTNDLMAPAGTETEEIPGENKNLVEPSLLTAISREEMPREAYVIHCGVSLVPHPKALTGGEDAYFVAGSWFGVADGVSNWSIEGTSAGIYARELMEKCANITSNNSGISPVDVLSRSVNESPSHGLSTILVAHFDGQVLHVANIGDSRTIVIRNNSIHKRTLPMHHEFNLPLLVGNGDNPFKLAEEHMFELDDGDVVITATDGLFDNVYEEEIESIISKSLQAKSKPHEIAEILASRAQEVGRSVTCRSPFADGARAAGYVRYAGGKLDDVTVIVSMVKTNTS